MGEVAGRIMILVVVQLVPENGPSALQGNLQWYSHSLTFGLLYTLNAEQAFSLGAYCRGGFLVTKIVYLLLTLMQSRFWNAILFG